ncbi:MAG: histidine phosphatase family protein [Lactococcus sp.]
MKHLYLMRHGETLFNVQGRTQGWSDSPLTAKGIADAKKSGDFMKQYPVAFDHFYSSTQERASDTLELVFPGVSYDRLKGLKEANFGAFEGHQQYLEPQTTEGKATFFSQYGGETRYQVADRMADCLSALMENESHQNVFCLSHGAAIWYFMHEKTAFEPLTFQGLHNLDLLHFTYDEKNKSFRFVELIKTI